MKSRSCSLWMLGTLLLAAGCSGTSAIAPPPGAGGTESAGGSANPGGGNSSVAPTGGNSQVAPAGGAANPSGGNPATGGAVSTSSTGGTKAGGDTSATGGTKATTGGTSSTGGTKAGGGTSVAGGTKAVTGGASPTGGSNAGGGTKATGGAGPTESTKVATGGAGPTGGTKATTGDASSTGGSSSAGGAASFKCANLSFKPSTTGKAKPSGTAGGMKVLNWAGFSSAVSYTFDDANSSQINNYTAMKNAGGHYTFYLITSKTEASSSTYKTALADGNEIGNHTSDHSNCTSASAIDSANTFIKSTFGVTAYAFAAPNGSSNCDTTSVSSKFLTDRSVSGGQTVSPGDISKFSWLPADIPSDSASAMGPSAGNWRIFCIHGFTGGSDGAYQPVTLSNWVSAVQSAISGGSWVETVTNIAAYNWGQHAIGSQTTSATWTKPSVFPSNMCVRITTTGGTVTQNGQEVPWDDHGYYEISLDAGSVTVQ